MFQNSLAGRRIILTAAVLLFSAVMMTNASAGPQEAKANIHYSDGLPAGGAAITIQSEGANEQKAVCDAAGQFSLELPAAGNLTLAVTSGGNKEYGSVSIPVAFFGNGPVSIVLPSVPAKAPAKASAKTPQSGIQKTVYTFLGGTVYGGSKPLANTTVTLFDTVTQDQLESRTTGSDGVYSRFLLPDGGTYKLLVSPPAESGFPASWVEDITVIFGEDVTQNVVLLAAHPCLLGGTVFAPDGVTGVAGLEIIANDKNPVISAFTDANGHYEMQLAPGTYSLRAIGHASDLSIPSPDYFEIYGLLPSLALSENTVQDITLPFVTLSGKTTNSTGAPVAGASVSVPDCTTVPNGFCCPAPALSDANGNYVLVLMPGSYAIVATPPGGGGYTSTAFDVSVSGNTTLDLALNPAFVLSGMVHAPDGVTGVAGLEVVARDVNLVNPLVSARTDVNGHYEMSLAPGTYRIDARGGADNLNIPSPKYFEMYRVVPNVALLGDTSQDVTLSFATLSGKTTDGSGAPVAGVSVTLPCCTSVPNGYVCTSPTTSDAGGNYALILLPGPFDVVATPPENSGLASTGFAVSVPGDTVRDLALSPTLLLGGTVYAPDGVTGVAGLEVAANDVNFVHPSVSVTDADGHYEILLAAGTYRIDVNGHASDAGIPCPDSFQIHGIVPDITLSADTSQDIRLPFVTLSGKTTDSNGVPVAGVRVSIPYCTSVLDDLGCYAPAVSDENGNYSLVLLATKYNLTITPPSGSGFATIGINSLPIMNDMFQNIILNLVDTTTPVIVSGPQVTAITDSTAMVQWQTNESATSVVRHGTSDPPTAELSVTGYQTDHAVPLTGLTPDTKYYVQVFSSDQSGNGPASSEVLSFTTTTLPDTKAPAILEGPTATGITDNSAMIQWTTDEPSQSMVKYGLSSPPGENVSESAWVTDHSVVLTNLTPATEYSVQVFATDAVGNGPTESTIISFVTLEVIDTTPPVITEGPTVQDITNTEATITWSTDEPATSGVSYNDGTAYGVAQDDALTLSHSVRLTSLSPETLYHFTAACRDALGNGPTLSDTQTFKTQSTPDSSPPVIVDGPLVTSITDNSAVVTWQTNESATSVARCDTDDPPTTELSGVGYQTLHEVPLTGLTASTTYHVQVFSSDHSGNGPTSSGVISFTTLAPPDTTSPVIVTGPLLTAITDSTATVEWQTNEPATTVVRYGTSNPPATEFTGTGYETNHGMTLTGLAASTTYHVQVSSSDASGNGPVSSGVISFTTLAPPDTTAPVILTGPLVTAITYSTAVVEWQTNESATTVVLYGTSDPPTTPFVGTGYQTDHEMTLTGLAAGTTYHVQVFSSDEAGNGPTSSGVISFTTPAPPDTAAPVILAGPLVTAITVSTAVVQWQTNEPATTVVRYGTDDPPTTELSGSGYQTDHEMTLTGLAADTTYRVRVFSSDEAGNGPTSSGVISFTTPAPPDTTAPVILAGPLVTAITVSTAVVQWQTNETATTVVHYGTDDPPTTELSGSGYQTDHEMTLTGLAADTTYRVQVFSSDEAGNGPASSGVISFKTLAPPDTTAPVIVAGPLATSITDSTAVVVWQTNEPATSLVRYGTSDPPSMEYSISGYRTNHVVPLAGLTAGTTYRVQVFSSDESGNGPVSSGVISFKTLTPPDTTPPVIVAGPLVTAITDSTAVVGWQTNESATSLVRYGTSDPPTTELSVSGYQTNHVVTLTGLAAGTTYRVQAFSADEAGNGPASSGVVSFTTLAPPDTKAPVILAGPMVTSITDSTAVVEWLTNESATSVTRYGTGNPPTTECSGTGYQTDHTVPLTGLAPSTKYYLQVFSSDPSGNGPVSSGVVSFTTLALPDTKAPLILEGPIATGISDSSAMLQWATDEPSQSVALCGLSSPPGQRVSESAWVTGHNLVLSGLAPATTYFAQVFATDAAGNGPAESAVISFVTLEAADTTPPVILEGPMAIDISDTGATVYWTTDEPATGGVSYYDGGVYGVVRDDALTLRHSVRLTSLTPETLYSFTVASRDTSGNGPAQSDTQNFNTLATPDTSPPLIIEGPLIVNITHQSVVIRWETDESADTVIEYGLTDTLGLQESRAALVTHHNMPIVGLDPDTTYYFRVLSTDAVGNGPAASGVYSFKTDVKGPCQKPVFTVDPAVISATDTTATIYWRTDQPADSVVLYGTKKLTLSSSDSTMVTEHQITLTNLAAGQSYKYEARSSNECGEAAASGQLSRKEVETFTTNLEPDTTAPGFVSPPQVVNTTNTAATIQWTTDELADSRVSYGLPGKGMPITVGSTAFTLEHTVVLTNLSRSTLYEFKASSRDISRNGPTESGIASFITAAVADETHPVFNPEPAVSGITKDRATVGWGTDELATSLVVYGTAANDLRSLTCVTGVTKDHAVIVPALQAGTQYFYAAVSMDQWGNLATSDSGSFTTLKTLVTVPDVVGQAQTAAGAALTAANLTVGGITAQCSDTAAAGLVISQTPAAGGQTPSGSAVDLVVSSGPCAAEGEGETPETEASLRARLAVDFDVMDTDGNGTVSFAEALTTLTNLTQKVFNAVDTDGDGQISRDEAGLKPKCGCFGCKSAFTADTMKEFFSNVFPGV